MLSAAAILQPLYLRPPAPSLFPARTIYDAQVAAVVPESTSGTKATAGKTRRVKATAPQKQALGRPNNDEEKDDKGDADTDAEQQDEEEDDSGDENDGGLFLASGKYLNDIPDDESNDEEEEATAGKDDTDASGDEEDGGLFLANGTYLNDIPDDESNDDEEGGNGQSDANDSDAPEEISFKASAAAKKGRSSEADDDDSRSAVKTRGKRGGKRQRLDTSVLDAVAANESEDSDGSDDDDGGRARKADASAVFQGSRTTFNSDSEDDNDVAAAKLFRPVTERRVVGAGGLKVRASLPKAKARAAGRPVPAAVLDFRKSHFAQHRRAESTGQQRGKGKARPAKQFVVGRSRR